MKKKLLALLLSGSMILTMVGCGSGETKVTESSVVTVESSVSTESTSTEASAEAISSETVEISVASEESISSEADSSNESLNGLPFHFPKVYRMEFEFSEEYASQVPYTISCSVDQNSGSFTMAYTSIDDSSMSLEIATIGNKAYLSVGDTKVVSENTEDISSMNEGIVLNDDSINDGTTYEELYEVEENGTTYIVYKMSSTDEDEDEIPSESLLYVNKSSMEIEKFTLGDDENGDYLCKIIPLKALEFSPDGYTEVTEEEFANAYMYGIFALVFGSMDMSDESLFDDYDEE